MNHTARTAIKRLVIAAAAITAGIGAASAQEPIRLGLAMPLARAQLYDAAIQHGVGDDPDSLGSLIARAGRRRSAASGEDAWLDAFFDVRITTLRAPSNTATAGAWSESTDRVECMRRLARSSHRSLETPFLCEVFGATFSIT